MHKTVVKTESKVYLVCLKFDAQFHLESIFVPDGITVEIAHAAMGSFRVVFTGSTKLAAGFVTHFHTRSVLCVERHSTHNRHTIKFMGKGDRQKSGVKLYASTR